MVSQDSSGTKDMAFTLPTIHGNVTLVPLRHVRHQKKTLAVSPLAALKRTRPPVTTQRRIRASGQRLKAHTSLLNINCWRW